MQKTGLPLYILPHVMRWAVCVCFAFFSCVSSAQKSSEKGLLNIRNYLPKEYGAQPQNLCALQDERGIMYFGNNSGVLEYDGFYWRIIKVSNETSVSALARDKNNTVYAGAENDLGKLVPGKNGSLDFKSLVSELPEGERDFGRVYRIIVINDTICFQSRKYIFRWVKNKFIKTITTPSSFHLAFNIKNTLLVRVRDEGMYFLQGEKLIKLKNSEIFATESVYEILDFRGKLCFITGNLGVFEYSKEEEFIPLYQDIKNAYAAVTINDSYLAIGTFDNGLVLLNRDFYPESNIGLSTGLQDGTVNSLFLDREQNLWLMLNRGIAKIEVVSPISVHNYDTGLKGTVEDIIRYKGNIFVATQNGVFYFNNNTGETNKFTQIQNLDIDCYSLTTFITNNDTLLLAAGVDGVYDISNKTATKITSAAPWKIAQSKYDRDVLIIANDDGLSFMHKRNTGWTENMYVSNVPDQIYNFAQSKLGDLWLGTADKGVIQLGADFFRYREPALKKYAADKGIPEGPVFVYCDNRDDIYLGSDDGVFTYDKTEDKFKPNPKFNLSNKTCGIHRISKDIYGNFWISVFYPDNTYDIYMGSAGAWNKTPFLRYNSEVFQAFYHDEHVTWLGSATGLIRFETELQKKYDSPFYVNLRQVTLGKNSVFHGTFTQTDSTIRTTQGNLNEFEFSYSKNNFVFEFSASTFFDERSTRYSYKMVGLEENWSEWSFTPRAEYNYIAEGDYVLMVKARNVYGNISKVMQFRFSISPPWYRTIWAYIGYIIVFISIIWLAILVSTRSLKRIIKERTTEIVEQKEEIEHQKEALEEKNKDITDSIKYAKRIQDAILPSEARMAELLKKDLFILFKPKDIVSGDFYWMHASDDITFFSAVDCTGHGVPGAFVSLIGHNSLNRSVTEFGLTVPAKVLDNLAVLVEDAFKQKGSSEVKDGMDISLCGIRKQNNDTIIEWAGANNPIWIISKKEVEMLEGNPEKMRVENFRDLLLTEIKPDKQPIGKFDARKPYTHYSIKPNPGDCIYIFTDGYADQFGGRDGKKFKYAQLKSVITTLYNLSMTDQGRELERIFENWRSDFQQLDDVCIIGVRV